MTTVLRLPPPAIRLARTSDRSLLRRAGPTITDWMALSFRDPLASSCLSRLFKLPLVHRRVRHRRRRRSDQHRQNITESSSFSEVSHSHKNGQHSHVHGNGHVRHHGHELYPHDGIHNIDHHHVHVQDQEQFGRTTLSLSPAPQLVTGLLRVQEPLWRQADIRVESLQQKQSALSYLDVREYPVVTKADLLYEEMEREDERRRRRAREEVKKEKTVTTSETVTTKVRRNILDTSANGGPQVGANGGVAGLAETVKNTVIGFLTPPKGRSQASIVESSESGFEDGSLFGEKTGTHGNNETFKPARKFFDEADTRERLNSDYFSGSDTPSKLRESTRRLSIRKPYNKYIAYSSDEELEEWR
ncbi:uncharacterized protein [Palaemon carinicauda]|uniref:uncharacterized protein n=1 Tax=Palaemon carinicauda TaxID=392227 RepID=UPI0035B64A10